MSILQAVPKLYTKLTVYQFVPSVTGEENFYQIGMKNAKQWVLMTKSNTSWHTGFDSQWGLNQGPPTFYSRSVKSSFCTADGLHNKNLRTKSVTAEVRHARQLGKGNLIFLH